MFQGVRNFFADPARQALGWAALGIAGVGLAAAGLYLMTRGNEPPHVQSLSRSTSSPTLASTATGTPSPTATATVSASPSASVSPSATAAPSAEATRSTANSGAATATSEPSTPEPAKPTPLAAASAGGPYCNTVSQSGVPTRVFGVFSVGGFAAPAGALVALAFDGVAGPANQTPEAGGYRVDFAPAGADCANRVGAVITLVYNGVSYATGHTVGDAQSRAGFLNVPLAAP